MQAADPPFSHSSLSNWDHGAGELQPPGEERQTGKLKDEPHQVIQGLREGEAKASISPMNPQLGFKFQYLCCSLSSVCWGIIFPAPAGRMECEQECSRVGREEKNVSLFRWLKFWGQGFSVGGKSTQLFSFQAAFGISPFFCAILKHKRIDGTALPSGIML